MNPAHGEPGHRCELPVGAPLDSKPSASGQPSGAAPTLMNPSPSSGLIAPSPSAPASGSVAAGTNPAHGQPGHDCAIPVGAPLKK
jgi:hypothetical protein